MVNMEVLNDAELLYNLQAKYEKDDIYTYIGPTLLVMNPYREIKELVGEGIRR